MRENMFKVASSKILEQKENPTTKPQVLESNQNISFLPTSKESIYGELHKSMSFNEESSQYRQEETAPNVIEELMTCTHQMQHKSDFNSNRNSRSVQSNIPSGPLKRILRSSQTTLINCTKSDKSSKKLRPRCNSDNGGAAENLSIVLKEASTECMNSKRLSDLTKDEMEDSPLMPSSSREVAVSSSQENLSFSKIYETVEKLQPKRNPELRGQNLQPCVENTPKLVERGLDKGYNWRKYGEKLSKRSVSSRSYYRCTFTSCEAKKQVERSHNVYETNVKYIGKHLHPHPSQELNFTSSFQQAQVPQKTILSASKTVSTSTDGNHDKDDYQDTKRLKIEIPTLDDNLLDRLNNDSRDDITPSEVDLANDGYRWRKYVQKLIKCHPNPSMRSYYRCTNGGCPAKKHVERASHDPRVVITTYEGKHSHDTPPPRVSKTTP